jgi:uncharacterized protein YjbJ (UPF0337 family)
MRGHGVVDEAMELSCRLDVSPSAGSRPLPATHQHRRNNAMGSTTDKIKGVANRVGGKFKEEVGEAVGNKRMQGEGMAQQVKGKLQQKVGEAKDAVKSVADRVADKAHDKL